MTLDPVWLLALMLVCFAIGLWTGAMCWRRPATEITILSDEQMDDLIERTLGRKREVAEATPVVVHRGELVMMKKPYECPVCGTDDPSGYMRCYRPGCTDGRDPR